MKRLTDPRLQRILAHVANDQTIGATAQWTIQRDLIAIDAELTEAREERATRPDVSAQPSTRRRG